MKFYLDEEDIDFGFVSFPSDQLLDELGKSIKRVRKEGYSEFELMPTAVSKLTTRPDGKLEWTIHPIVYYMARRRQSLWQRFMRWVRG